MLDTLGMTAMTFAISGMAYWMPDYLSDSATSGPRRGLSPQLIFGGLIALAGLLATLLGGLAGDALRRRAVPARTSWSPAPA